MDNPPNASTHTPSSAQLETSRKDEASFWKHIDAAMVVNLAERTDRWERISGILSKHLPTERIVRVDALKGVDLPGYKKKPWFSKKTSDQVAVVKAGAAGCCLSHRKAIEMAKQAGYRRILLLEDDADFQNELDGAEGEAVGSVLENDSAWDMFYLGFYQKHNKHYIAKQMNIKGQPFELRRIRGPLMLHACVIHERIFDALLDGLPDPDHPWPWMAYWGSIDAWIQNRFGRDPRVRIWATEPKLVMQVATWSDICGRMLTEEESQGTHRPTYAEQLDKQAFERSIPLGLGDRLYQTYKYGSRRLKARLFGHTKT